MSYFGNLQKNKKAGSTGNLSIFNNSINTGGSSPCIPVELEI
jgi:hypothetical protein